MAQDDPIAQFWAWWPALVDRLKPATESVLLAELDELVRRVEDIHPKIQVLGKYKPGRVSWLCLSSRGNLEVRPIVERWTRRAPRSDDWRFLTARPPSWPPRRSTPFPLEELTCTAEVDELREAVDVTLHHPEMASLDPVHRDTLAFVALDHLLGEDGVERWIGNVEVSEEAIDGEPLETLRERVRTLSTDATGERWQALRAGGKDNPILVTINRAIKPLDHYALPLHVRIDLTLQKPNKYGLAHGKEALELDDLQKELTRTLGTRAVVIARETHKGHRILHLHADEAAVKQIHTWRQKYPQWTIQVLEQEDPSWEVTRRWGSGFADARISSFPPPAQKPSQ